MKGCKANKGATLIEILAAMVLLSIVAFPLVKTFLDGFKFQARSQVKTEANKVIEYVTEQLKNEKYGDLGTSKTDIESWVKGGNDNLASFEIISLPGSKLTAAYEVSIDKNSISMVQEGGIGTPDTYELEIEIDEDDVSVSGNGDFLNVTYSSGQLIIDSKVVGVDSINNGFYAIFINSSIDTTLEIRKEIEDVVKVYYQGNITLRDSSDPDLSRNQKTFQRIFLGDKYEIKNESEYLCNAKITAINKEDPSISSSMNVTFSVFVENED